MKKFTLSAILAFVLSLSVAVIYSSCKKDPCKDVVCQNDGVCDDGTCDCTTGYEGDDCSTEWRAKFIASYKSSGTDNTGGTYTDIPTNIATSSSGVSKIIINITGAFSFTATLTSSTTFTVDNQTVSGYTYSGTGTLSGSNIALSLTEVEVATSTTTIYTLNMVKI